MDAFLANLTSDQRKQWNQLTLADSTIPKICLTTAMKFIQELTTYSHEIPHLDLNYIEVLNDNKDEYIPNYQSCISIYLYWEELSLTLTFKKDSFTLELFDTEIESEDNQPLHFTYDELDNCISRISIWMKPKVKTTNLHPTIRVKARNRNIRGKRRIRSKHH